MNNVKNIITISGNKEVFAELVKKVKGYDDEYGWEISFDFKSIDPMPDDVWGGDISAETREAYPGDKNWYDWSINHWGTLCNAYEHEERENGFVFLTAWSAPHPVIEGLAKLFPTLTIRHKWADEDIGRNCGTRVYKGGKLISENQSEAYPPLPKFIAFAKRVWRE